MGLRDFISLEEFTQSIDTERRLAVNTVGFCVAGLGMLKGALTIEASYQAVSPTRVDISFQSASLVRNSTWFAEYIRATTGFVSVVQFICGGFLGFDLEL